MSTSAEQLFFNDLADKNPMEYIDAEVPSNKSWIESERIKHGSGLSTDIPRDVLEAKAASNFMANSKILITSNPAYATSTPQEQYTALNNKWNGVEEEEVTPVAVPTLAEVAATSKTRLDGEWWAKYYNAESSPLEERVAKYKKAMSIKPTAQVIKVTDHAINSGAFDHEIKELGLTKEELRKSMLDIAKIESSGGHLSKEKQVSDTGAQGLFQVVESTARGVLEKGNYFGPNAAKAAGTTLPKLRAMDRPELQKFLLNNDKGNTLFAAAVIMQKIKHNKNKES